MANGPEAVATSAVVGEVEDTFGTCIEFPDFGNAKALL